MRRVDSVPELESTPMNPSRLRLLASPRSCAGSNSNGRLVLMVVRANSESAAASSRTGVLGVTLTRIPLPGLSRCTVGVTVVTAGYNSRHGSGIIWSYIRPIESGCNLLMPQIPPCRGRWSAISPLNGAPRRPGLPPVAASSSAEGAISASAPRGTCSHRSRSCPQRIEPVG